MVLNTMYGPELQRLGQRIQQLRTAQALSAAEVARALDIDTSHYYGIERGRNLPSLPLLGALAAVFRVGMADFFPRRHI
jgi:transcriptional regulator with XRE-family HTH domain